MLAESAVFSFLSLSLFINSSELITRIFLSGKNEKTKDIVLYFHLSDELLRLAYIQIRRR